MMKRQCPFCWSDRVRSVRSTAGERTAPADRFLLECLDCEKWFWANSGEEIPRLYEVCETAVLNPVRCFPELREAVLWDDLSPSRQAEFNFLCSQCRFRSFRAVGLMLIVTG